MIFLPGSRILNFLNCTFSLGLAGKRIKEHLCVREKKIALVVIVS